MLHTKKQNIKVESILKNLILEEELIRQYLEI